MADWSVVLLAIGPAVVTGFFSYLVGKRSADVSLRAIDAENERLREQIREDHFRHRQGTYHDLLNADRAWIRMSHEVPQPTVEEMELLLARLDDAANGVRLFGADDVRVAAEALLKVYGDIGERVGERVRSMQTEDAEELNQAVTKGLAESHAALTAARETLLVAMRDDVGHRPAEST